MTTHTPRCIARHTGIWMVEPEWFNATLSAVRAGTYRMLTPEQAEAQSAPVAYMTEDGIGIVNLSGPMMKGASKFGNADTTALRQTVRQLANDPGVRGIVLVVDSPGGTFAGTDELAQDIASAAKVKPVYAQFEDMAASAAYYASAGASALFATPTTFVGSIGTMLVVEDSSGAAEQAGIKVHVIATGDYKASVVDGAPVSEEALNYLRETANKVNGFFLQAVKKGRGLTDKRMSEVSSGKVWLAAEAQSLGLIDGVQRLEQTVDAMRGDLKARDKAARTRARMDTARLRG